MKKTNPVAKSELSIEMLRKILIYNAETGEFTWQAGPRIRNPGLIAGFAELKGYRRIRICGRNYYAHRLAWLYVNGVWPASEIDHIDGDKSNNRITNLREVSQAVNAQNIRTAKTSNRSSGLLGVSFHRKSGKFQAKITHIGKQIHLGSFDDKSDAYQAYLNAKRQIHGGCTI